MKRAKKGVPHERSALPDALEKRLMVYALAATAAGAGLMAAAQPAHASIITYTPSPPFTVTPKSGFQTFSSRGVGQLAFEDSAFSLLAGSVRSGNPFVMLAPGMARGGDILKLKAGAPIGTKGNFQTFGIMESRSGRGQWTSAAAGYIGMRFLHTGKSYFGWAKVSNVTTEKGIFATLDEVAVDTVPGQTIDAGQTSTVPEPGTLSLLALGAAGLFALRKRKLSAMSDQ
jgi:hypothetical protein